MRVRASVTCGVGLSSFVCFCVGTVALFSEELIA